MGASANQRGEDERGGRRLRAMLAAVAGVRPSVADSRTSPASVYPHGASPAAVSKHTMWFLLRALLGIEAFLLVLAAVIPVGGVSLTISPLVQWWPWMLAPARLLFGDALVDASIPPAAGWTALALVAVALVGAACVSGLAAWQLHTLRDRLSADWRWLALVLGGALLLGVTLVLLPALPSDDVFSYILYGRISVIHHANPLITVPSAFPNDPFLSLVYWRDTRSVYGAVWLLLSGGIVRLGSWLGGSLAVYVLLFKSLGLVAHLANAVLIWAILGVLAPRRQLVGTLLYAWNPLCLLEFCASSHNDAIMLFFLLLAVYLLVRGWELGAMVALGLSIATKYMPVILVPFYLLLVWRVLARRGVSVERRVVALAWRSAVIGLVMVVTVLPYWSGTQTLGSLLYSPPAQNLDNSLTESLSWPLSWLLQSLLHLDTLSARHLAISAFKVLMLLGFAVFWLAQWRRSQSVVSLLETWGWALVGYAVIASGWFWPWYVTWAVAVVALVPWQRLTSGTLLLAGSVLTLYGFLPLQSSPLYGFRSGLEFLPAIVLFLWPWLRRGWDLWSPRVRAWGRLRALGEANVRDSVDTTASASDAPELTEGVAEHG